jgi:hypothetical protein
MLPICSKSTSLLREPSMRILSNHIRCAAHVMALGGFSVRRRRQTASGFRDLPLGSGRRYTLCQKCQHVLERWSGSGLLGSFKGIARDCTAYWVTAMPVHQGHLQNKHELNNLYYLGSQRSKKPKIRPRGSVVLTTRHPLSRPSGSRSVGIVRSRNKATEFFIGVLNWGKIRWARHVARMRELHAKLWLQETIMQT